MCFSWSGGTRYVTELAVLLGLTDTRSVMMARTPGTKATGGNAPDALEQLDTFQAATFRSAVGLIGYIDAAKTVRSATREPTKLDWMQMMRLAKFLVSHNDSNGSIRRRMCLRSMWCLETQTGQARSHVGAQQEHERQSCMLQDVRQREDCNQSSCWLRLEWSRNWKYSRTVPQTSACTTELDRGECDTWT